MVSEADRIKELSAKESSTSNAGGSPTFTIQRPKRKRAFHRALKRGERWALSEKSSKEIMSMIGRLALDEILKATPFLGMLKTKKEREF